MDKIIEYIEGAKGVFVFLGGAIIALIRWYDNVIELYLKVYRKLTGNDPQSTQFYKTLMANKDDAFNNACLQIFNSVESSVIVDVAKIKNGMKAFAPDSELNEMIIGSSGHPMAKEYFGEEGEHPLDPSFYEHAAESMSNDGSILRIEDLKNPNYIEVIKSIGHSCIRIYWISTSSEYSYFLYIGMKSDKPLTYKEKRIIRLTLKELKNKYFSKKNYMV